jgi:hypothetical protein
MRDRAWRSDRYQLLQAKLGKEKCRGEEGSRNRSASSTDKPLGAPPVHQWYTTAVRYGSVHSGTGKTGAAYLRVFVNSSERW